MLTQLSKGRGVSADVDALTSRIAALLLAESGDRMIRRLFLDLLGFERVEQPVPTSVLSDLHRGHVAEATILGRLDTLYVCRVKGSASQLLARHEEPVCRQLAKAWPGCLVAFSSFGEAEWDLCHAAPDGTIRRLPLDQNLFAVDELTQLLLSLRAFDLDDDEALPQLEVQAAAERMFRRAPKRVRRRLRKVLQGSLLFPEIGRWELLTALEEQALATRMRAAAAGIDADAALSRMVCANLRLALQFARRFAMASGGRVELDDLWQEACVGLVIAARRFDPDRGFRFSTYATWWVRQAVGRAKQSKAHTVEVPVHLHGRLARWRNAWRQWLVTRGYRPTVEELAKTVGEDPADAIPVLAAWRAFRRPMSLGYRLDILDTRRIQENGHDDRQKELAQALFQAFDRLDDRQRDVLTRRFGLDGKLEMTLEELGEVYGLTRERIRQIEVQALSCLRNYFQTTEGKNNHDFA